MSSPQAITINGDFGGKVIDYVEQVEIWRKDKTLVRIDGECASACTLVLSLPKEQVCIGPKGSLGFHKGSGAWADANLRHAYSPDLKTWIDEQGGLRKEVFWARSATAKRFVQTCDPSEETAPAALKASDAAPEEQTSKRDVVRPSPDPGGLKPNDLGFGTPKDEK